MTDAAARKSNSNVIAVTPVDLAFRAGRRDFQLGRPCPPRPRKRGRQLTPETARHMGWMVARGAWALTQRDERRRAKDLLGVDDDPDGIDEERYLDALLESRPSR